MFDDTPPTKSKKSKVLTMKPVNLFGSAPVEEVKE